MATGDIYRAVFNCSTNGRAWSTSCCFTEQSPTNDDKSSQAFADAIAAHFETTFRGIITGESFLESVTGNKLWPTRARGGLSVLPDARGSVAGQSMPSNNALVLRLIQSFGDAKYNGRMYIAGQADQQHQENNWLPAYLNGAVKNFCDQLLVNVPGVNGDGGAWASCVLASAEGPNLTPKGNPLDLTGCNAIPRVLTMKKRQTAVRGWAASP